MVLDDNHKIGIALICLGIGFFSLGVALLCDSAFIAIGNCLFLVGLCFTIGITRAFALFARRDRLRGTFCFFSGMILVTMRWGLIGMCLEVFGFLNLFGNFLPTALAVARQIPGISIILDLPLISQAVDLLAGKTRPKYSV